MNTMAPRWIFSAISATLPSPPEYRTMRASRMNAMINPTIPAIGTRIGGTVMRKGEVADQSSCKTVASRRWILISPSDDLATKMTILVLEKRSSLGTGPESRKFSCTPPDWGKAEPG